MTDIKDNKVAVRIYGQEYVIAGADSREYIIRVADYVDRVIRDLGNEMDGVPLSKLTVLGAINIADEYFAYMDKAKGEITEKISKIEQLENDVAHFTQMWDEAKENLTGYKEEVKLMVEQKDALGIKLSELTIENDSLKKSLASKDADVNRLHEQASELSDKIETKETADSEIHKAYAELKDRLKEVEGNYFELQMENIKLKGEIELRKR
jgi:cell division protein ZapA